MPYLEPNINNLENQLKNNNNEEYQTAESYGADYSIGGRIKNWFTGENTNAENRAETANSKAAEERERKYNSEEAAKNRAYNAKEAETARQFAATEAEKSRKWEELMSNTKYQRMIKDAEKAGINPLYLIGAQSANLSGATAQSTTANAGGNASSSSKKPKNKGNDNELATIAKLIGTTALMLKLLK